MTSTPSRRHGLRLRARLRYFYHGQTPAAVRFRVAVIVIDFAIIGFFLAAPILKEHGRSFYVLDYAIAVVLALQTVRRTPPGVGPDDKAVTLGPFALPRPGPPLRCRCC